MERMNHCWIVFMGGIETNLDNIWSMYSSGEIDNTAINQHAL